MAEERDRRLDMFAAANKAFLNIVNKMEISENEKGKLRFAYILEVKDQLAGLFEDQEKADMFNKKVMEKIEADIKELIIGKDKK